MMSDSLVTAPAPSDAAISHPDELAARTRDFAADVFEEVAEHYLAFRRVYYHEDQPSLATTPPRHAEVRRGELALLADNTLRLVPHAVKSLPLVGGLLEHLEEVANVHSISEKERTALHNMTIIFLYGVKDGIQPWYVEWLVATAHNLAGVTDEHYFMVFPWDACLYIEPRELVAFDAAVRTGDVAGIEWQIRQTANRLVEALRDPIEVQPRLAFTGPEAERRRALFHLKTATAVALGAYLITAELRTLLHKREVESALRSAQAPLPEDIAAHRVKV